VFNIQRMAYHELIVLQHSGGGPNFKKAGRHAPSGKQRPPMPVRDGSGSRGCARSGGNWFERSGRRKRSRW